MMMMHELRLYAMMPMMIPMMVMMMCGRGVVGMHLQQHIELIAYVAHDL
jgi:hypothetical protein